MSEHLFLRTTIAIVWDFDTTLIPGYMQEPLFRRFGVDGNQFWKKRTPCPSSIASVVLPEHPKIPFTSIISSATSGLDALLGSATDCCGSLAGRLS